MSGSNAVFRQRVDGHTQCAGHECPERDGCSRYECRFSKSNWASFDIERARIPGPCVHRVPMRQG